jgi:hypothetical protein
MERGRRRALGLVDVDVGRHDREPALDEQPRQPAGSVTVITPLTTRPKNGSPSMRPSSGSTRAMASAIAPRDPRHLLQRDAAR